MSPLKLCLLLLPVAIVGCSSGSSWQSDSSPPARLPAAFSKFCTGVLKAKGPLFQPYGGAGEGDGSWIGNGAYAAAGTTFLVGVWARHFEGFVILADGSVRMVRPALDRKLAKDTDFSSDCAPADPPAENCAPPRDSDFTCMGGHFVLLADSNFYPSQDLTSAPCTIPAATELTESSFSGGTGVAKITAAELKGRCGFEVGYTKDLRYGILFAR